ncbi:hypothetical protein HPP92_016072 [Vanilla planifolia]|uniref:Uncharacterized protein n=1 Tax=Vanilla planifolia TaxID=51239 RepID=A0A835QIG9_VANPL|nr:hypothetical protein HPP92_016683 [Vanilla planifolia]KAG0471526.1 hypothetical protein HPP92_016072 [Vanilla planifolia]
MGSEVSLGHNTMVAKQGPVNRTGGPDIITVDPIEAIETAGRFIGPLPLPMRRRLHMKRPPLSRREGCRHWAERSHVTSVPIGDFGARQTQAKKTLVQSPDSVAHSGPTKMSMFFLIRFLKWLNTNAELSARRW